MTTKTKTSPSPATANQAGVKYTGRDLIPDLASMGQSLREERVYWVGVRGDCPVELIDLAGVNFPKANNVQAADPGGGPMKVLIPAIGALVRLTQDQVERMRERLSRTVIRFTEQKLVRDEGGTGENVGDDHQRARRGHVITIPSESEIADREKRGRPSRKYVRDSKDEPAANYMFARVCLDQENPRREGHFYPPSLAETGLEWAAN